MKNLIQLKDYTTSEIQTIFEIAGRIDQNEYNNFLKDKTIILYFPDTSIRTRVTFEKGISQLCGKTILFPSGALDKKEEIKDVIGYLNNWADAIIVRHPNESIIEEMAKYSKVPIINAMTSSNHPCEILTDLYALSMRREDYLQANYLYIGEKSNIGLTWKEASEILGFSFTQCCPAGYEMENVIVEHDINKAFQGKDIILTDTISKEKLEAFRGYQVTLDLLRSANPNALFNPCPPFYRGEEVAAEAIDSKYFVGYEFKKSLLEVQQAIIIYHMMY